jgi:CRISPR/Cas system-associated endonuclease Cas1
VLTLDNLECVNSAFGLAIKMEDLPKDGSDMIANRIEEVLRARHGYKELDKDKVLSKMLQQFDRWDKASDLPGDTAEKATQLFKTINAAFSNVR